MIPRLRGTDAMLAPVIVGVAAVHALLVWTVLRVVTSGRAIGDWVSFYAAASMVREGHGARLFDAGAQTATQQAIFGPEAVLNFFPLPAFVAIAFAPLAALSFRESYFVWMAINCTMLVGLLMMARAQLSALPRSTRWLLLGCIGGSLPALNLLLLGQVDLLVVAGFAGCFALQRRRPYMAGLLLATAIVKPHIVAAPLLMLAVQRDWRTLAGFAAAAVPLMIAPALVLGPETLSDQAALLRSQASAAGEGRVNPWMMVNLRGLIVSATGSTATWLWLPPMAVAGGVATVSAVRLWMRSAVARTQAWAVACLLPLVYSPHLHVHALVLGGMALCLFASASVTAGRGASVTPRRIIALFASVTALWLVSVAGLSLLSLLVLASFAGAVCRWPRSSELRLLDAAEPEVLAAA